LLDSLLQELLKMASNEKFCLRWNDFENNISSAFKELRYDKEFFDVTLACDDEQVQAHKVILSACSPFFRTILLRNPHQHPLLYLQGVSYTDLQAVLDFMYHGEVNVAQEELNSFLAVSENLKVKGLTQNQTGDKFTKPRNLHQSVQSQPTIDKTIPKQGQTKLPHQLVTNTRPGKATVVEEEEIQEVNQIKSEPKEPSSVLQSVAPSLYSQHQPSSTLATADDQSMAYTEDNYDDYGEYHEEGNSQYQDGMDRDAGGFATGNVGLEGLSFQDPSELLQFVAKDIEDIYKRRYVCTICNQFFHQGKSNVRNHVECKHFPTSFLYNCELCGSSLPSKAALQKHKHKVHRHI